MTTFLDLEPARQVLLQSALQPQTRAIAQRGNKAARVVYQEAFATEISTVLNVFEVRNEAALRTVVCERQRVTAIDAQLQEIQLRIRDGLRSLFSLQALPNYYKGDFNDYLDSTAYRYRVSLVANLVLLARLTETTGQ